MQSRLAQQIVASCRKAVEHRKESQRFPASTGSRQRRRDEVDCFSGRANSAENVLKTLVWPVNSAQFQEGKIPCIFDSIGRGGGDSNARPAAPKTVFNGLPILPVSTTYVSSSCGHPVAASGMVWNREAPGSYIFIYSAVK